MKANITSLIYLSAMVGLFWPVPTVADVMEGTVTLSRRLGEPFLVGDAESPACELEVDSPIRIGTPQSIGKGDRYYVTGSKSFEAIVMTVDYINTKRCGVRVKGKNYPIELTAMGDGSSEERHAAIGNYLVNRSDFLLGGYTSLLTKHLAPIAEANGKVMVSGGSSSNAVFKDRDYSFGILPPSSLFLKNAIKAVAEAGASTLHVLVEDGISHLCGAVPDLAAQYGLRILETQEMEAGPTVEHMTSIAKSLSKTEPDVVISCTYAGACVNWIKAMREVDWNPKAQVFTPCIGLSELEEGVKSQDLTYMMGAASWDKNLPPIADAVTGWTPRAFASEYASFALVNVTYQNVAAATALSVLVQAIELADSLESSLVRDLLSSMTFDTMYATTSFDENGQNQVPSKLFQYDEDAQLRVVFPIDEFASEDFGLTYPMPSWKSRDCVADSPCMAKGGECLPDGSCDCSGVDGLALSATIDILWTGQSVINIGVGPTADCKIVPNEDFSFIAKSWKIVGYVVVAIQGLISLVTIWWTLSNKTKPIVQASQPFFLILLSIGSLLMVSAILPGSMEAEYRVVKDEFTGQLLEDESHPDIARADAACMATPWLACMGFAVVFSALFAKVLRIKKMMDNAATQNGRKFVEVRDVLGVMLLVILAESAILLAWQVVDPLKWDREIIVQDSSGFVLQSVGRCSSEAAGYFIIPLVVLNLSILGYALWLCYVTRSIPDDFAEGKWIAISMICIFQVCLLAVPVLIIVEDDATATFFVISGVLFLMSSSVCLLMFVPKMKRLAETGEEGREALRVQFNDAVVSRASMHKRRGSSNTGPEEARSGDPYNKRFGSTRRSSREANVSSNADGWARMNMSSAANSSIVRDTDQDQASSQEERASTHRVASLGYDADLVDRLRRQRMNRREAYGLQDLADDSM